MTVPWNWSVYLNQRCYCSVERWYSLSNVSWLCDWNCRSVVGGIGRFVVKHAFFSFFLQLLWVTAMQYVTHLLCNRNCSVGRGGVSSWNDYGGSICLLRFKQLHLCLFVFFMANISLVQPPWLTGHWQPILIYRKSKNEWTFSGKCPVLWC